MVRWQHVLAHVANDAEQHFDALKYRLGRRLGHVDPLMIAAYRGCGTSTRVYLKGRVLEDEGIRSAADNDSLWQNLLNMYRRFESDEVPYARVKVRFEGVEQEVVADEEGYFEVWIEPAKPLTDSRPWYDVELDLVAPLRGAKEPVKAVGQVYVPPPTARFGVISDIDDTIVQTDATSLLRMARTVFLGNARTRLPFEGVAAFYRALHNGAGGSEMNPLFYVSSSPWNLYDLFSDFFALQNIPGGPVLFLRDWGFSEAEGFSVRNRVYKLTQIKKLMSIYTSMPFILIGDSGQEDPEIYREVVETYPNRILAVYIRNVSRDPRRPEAIRALAQKVLDAGSTLILADNTLPMAQHAISQGWIAAGAFPAIHAEKEADEAPPGPIEKLLGGTEKQAGPEVVIGQGAENAAKPVEEGGVEEALKAGDEKSEDAPTVIVKGNPEDNGQTGQ